MLSEDVLDERLRALDKLSGIGPATWWPRLRGQLADRLAPLSAELSSAQVDVVSAKAAHRSSVERLMFVQARADDLSAAREAAASSLSGVDGDRARAIVVEVNEIAEAVFAAQSARLSATEVVAELSTAATWSNYDTFLGGGMLASGAKRGSIESANDAAQPLVNLLAQLRKELQDLGAPTAYFGVQLNDLTASLDVWWDNIFSDWTMHNRIDDAQERIQRLIAGLDELMEQLGQRRRDALDRLDALIAAASGSAG